MKTRLLIKNKSILLLVFACLQLFHIEYGLAQCTPTGNPTVYGSGSWKGYVYTYTNTSNPPTNAFETYRGFFNQSEIFDTDLGNGSISGASICGTYSDYFAVSYKMQKNFTAGNYVFTVGGDDGYRLSLDGGSTYIINNWSDHSYTSSTSAIVYLSGTTNLVLEYYEKGGLSRVSYSFSSCNNSTPPTSISAPSSLCQTSGGTTIYAVGGTSGSSAVFQWGTGTVGTNVITTTYGNSLYVNPSTTTTYWVRRIDPAPCSLTTSAATTTITVNVPSTQPTTISGTTTICAGQSTTLTVSGGTHGTGAVYEWGVGYSAGIGTISGATGSSITVSPTSQTGYWVRRVDPSPCPAYNSGFINTTVYVNPTSTAPTTITPTATSACPGTAITLTASGGTALSGSTYQWGTGSTIGSNVISGQTSASITVSPSANTTYWVRRFDPSCNLYTSGITYSITVAVSPGNPTVFGSNVWNVYGYSGADITLATATYLGYYSTNTLNFDTQSGTNSWVKSGSPSNSAGWAGCTVPSDNHTFTAKRSGFPCGTYTVAMQNWDDIAQLYINGTLVWSASSWSGNGNYNVVVGSYYLDSSSTIELRNRENGGESNISLTLTNTNIQSTAPTTISGTTSICSGSSTTLTVSGGTHGTTGSYEWGTGTTVGVNTISGATAASLTISPTTTTSYWVRRVDTLCGIVTSGVITSVTVSATSVAGTLACTTTTICKNTAVADIILSGNVGAVLKWQYASDSGFTSGVTDIASTATSLTSAQIGSFATTRYFRAVVQSGSCLVVYTPALAITVPAVITYNGSWSGTPTDKTSILISSNYTLTSDLDVCSCQITGTSVVTVPSGKTLRIQKEINVSSTASLTIENNGSLVQVDNTASNIGNITFKRNTSPLKQYDYTYFSSPIANIQLASIASNSMFYSFLPTANNWNYEASTTIMTNAKGYIFRAPSNLTYTTPQTHTINLNGTPNNGVIGATIVKATGTTYNLIGNPYPSAINIDQFLTDSTNANIVNGTIYLWTHNTAMANVAGTNIYVYTSDDYAKYNLTGGVSSANPAITGGSAPTGKIAAGQGFFIEANSSLANGTYTANFNNSMRISGNNNQFFRNANWIVEPVTPIEKHRVWLNITNDQGAYSGILVGYITGATQDIDSKYDGKTLPSGNVISFYSLLNNSEFAIQGRALPFQTSDVVPLGFNNAITGTFKIALENFDGLFTNQNIYLLDKTTNTYHDLKSGDYSFNLNTTGTQNNRFELHYTNGTLGNNEIDPLTNEIKSITNEGKIKILSNGESLASVQIYDLLGKTVAHYKNIDATSFETPLLGIKKQVLIIKITLANQLVVTRKIVL